MKLELENQLLDKYPWFKYKNNSKEHPKPIIKCYCGDGWYRLIDEMLEEIESLYRQKQWTLNSIHIYEVYQKYGTLQLFMNTDIPEEVYTIAEKYESLSESVCEVCGVNGSMRELNDWLKVLCDDCTRR